MNYLEGGYVLSCAECGSPNMWLMNDGTVVCCGCETEKDRYRWSFAKGNAEAVENMKRMQWTPFEHEMPKRGSTVLIHRNDGSIRTVVFWGYSDNETHWMPLPHPPKD